MGSDDDGVTEEDVAKGLDKISKDLGIEQLWEAILAGGDRRLARQRYEDEVARARKQVDDFFRENVLGRKMMVDTARVDEVKWKHDNSIFADVLLRADESLFDTDTDAAHVQDTPTTNGIPIGIPLGPASPTTKPNTDSSAPPSKPKKCALYPAHKAMLIRSEYFSKMFSGDFLEATQTEHLRVVTVDCTPEVLELILAFLYTESTDAITLDHALDLLYAADMLFLDTLKTKAAIAISTLGNGSTRVNIGDDEGDGTDTKDGGEKKTSTGPIYVEAEPVNIYDIIRAAWDLRVQRLEEFAARYLADRLEYYIDEDDFQDVIKESASRLKARQETDTIELLDDIRYYLSERFRHRFEDTGLEEFMDETGEINAEVAAQIAAAGDAEQNGVSQEVVPDATSANPVSNGHSVGDEHIKDTPAEVGENEEIVRTIDGAVAEDEFASDAINYQILLGKIDIMLDRLKLDA